MNVPSSDGVPERQCRHILDFMIQNSNIAPSQSSRCRGRRMERWSSSGRGPASRGGSPRRGTRARPSPEEPWRSRSTVGRETALAMSSRRLPWYANVAFVSLPLHVPSRCNVIGRRPIRQSVRQRLRRQHSLHGGAGGAVVGRIPGNRVRPGGSLLECLGRHRQECRRDAGNEDWIRHRGDRLRQSPEANEFSIGSYRHVEKRASSLPITAISTVPINANTRTTAIIRSTRK